MNKDIDRLNDVYENKLNLLNSKINSDDDNINEMKSEIKTKNDVLNFFNFKKIIFSRLKN